MVLYSHADRHKALRLVTNYQTTHQLVETWMKGLSTSRATAYRMLRQFKEAGLIQKEGKLWKLTERGRHYTETKFDYLMLLPKIRPKHAA